MNAKREALLSLCTELKELYPKDVYLVAGNTDIPHFCIRLSILTHGGMSLSGMKHLLENFVALNADICTHFVPAFPVAGSKGALAYREMLRWTPTHYIDAASRIMDRVKFLVLESGLPDEDLYSLTRGGSAPVPMHIFFSGLQFYLYTTKGRWYTYGIQAES